MQNYPLDWQSWSPLKPSLLKVPFWDYPPLMPQNELTQPTAKAPKPKISLWCTWHSNGTDINQNLVISQAKKFLTHQYVPEYILVDDGWCTWGDWDNPLKPSWNHNLKTMTYQLSQLGYKSGLWLAPFLVDKHSSIFQTHPEYLARDSSGNPINAFMSYPLLNRITPKYLLDVTNPQVTNYLRRILETVINGWGFTLLKLDHLYAPHFHPDPSHSSNASSAISSLFRHIDNHYPHVYTIACGAPFNDVLGHADAVRISKDINSPILQPISPLDHLLYLKRKSLLNQKLAIAQKIPELAGHIDPDACINVRDAKNHHVLWENDKIAVFGLGYNL